MSTGHILRRFRKAVQSSADFSSLVINVEERGGMFLELPIPSTDDTKRRNLQFSQTAIDLYTTDIFHRLDTDCNAYLSKLEIDRFLLKATGSSLNHVIYNYLVQHFEHTDLKIGLSLSAFLNGQAHVFNQLLSKSGNDIQAVEEAFHKEIEIFGYDRRSYFWTSGRPMVFSLHSDRGLKVSTIPYDHMIANLAQELFVSNKGKTAIYQGKCAVFVLNSGFEGASVVAENLQETKDLDVTIEFTGSDIVCSRCNGSLKYQCVIPPKRKHLCFIYFQTISTIRGQVRIPSTVVRSWQYLLTNNCFSQLFFKQFSSKIRYTVGNNVTDEIQYEHNEKLIHDAISTLNRV